MITLLRIGLLFVGLWCLSITGAGYFLRARAQYEAEQLEAREQFESREPIRIEESPIRHSYVNWQTCQIVRITP